MLAWYTVISLNQNKKRLDAGNHATKNKTRQILVRAVIFLVSSTGPEED